MNKDEADREAMRAQQIASMTGLFFVGQAPGVIGSALAELMATFLCNHKIPDNLAEQETLRQEILRT